MRGGDPRGRDEAARQVKKTTSKTPRCNKLSVCRAAEVASRRRQLRHQWDRIAAVVAKAGIVKCVWLREVIG